MRTEATLQAPNSLLLVTTADPPDIPVSIDPDTLTTQTLTCIAVGTMAEDDDEVTVVLSDEAIDDEQLSLACETAMDGGVGFIAVETVLGETVLRRSVPTGAMRVRVWASNLIEPDLVVVEFAERPS